MVGKNARAVRCAVRAVHVSFSQSWQTPPLCRSVQPTHVRPIALAVQNVKELSSASESKDAARSLSESGRVFSGCTDPSGSFRAGDTPEPSPGAAKASANVTGLDGWGRAGDACLW